MTLRIASNSSRVNILALYLLIVMIGYWTFVLLQPYPVSQAPWIFTDNLNLLIHEAGHLLFIFAGQFVHIIAGSLLQVLIPIIFLGYFWRTDQPAGVGFGLFWLGNNLINVSYYIRDAEHRLLPLLGGHGVVHDWQWLLVELGLLTRAGSIAMTVKVVGALVILGSIGYLMAIAIDKTSQLKPHLKTSK